MTGDTLTNWVRHGGARERRLQRHVPEHDPAQPGRPEQPGSPLEVVAITAGCRLPSAR